MESLFSNIIFHPVVNLPKNYAVFDFSKGHDKQAESEASYGVGKYNEKRPNMYKGELYEKENRNIHMGIDIRTPVNEKVFSFFAGEVFMTTYNALPLDYGYTIITKHNISDVPIYALYGHLSRTSLELSPVGKKIHAGDLLAYVGDEHENGGWKPHLHFQLSILEPKVCDMPGVVSEQEHEQALKDYPDPQLVLGKLY